MGVKAVTVGHELLQAGASVSRGAAAIRTGPLAVSDRAGQLGFVVDPENTGHSHLAGEEGAGGSRKVAVVTLDEWLFQSPAPSRIAAVKLDVEGCELRALKGMERMLREHRPAIAIEVIDEHLLDFGTRRADVFAFLSALGYSPDQAPTADGNLYLGNGVNSEWHELKGDLGQNPGLPVPKIGLKFVPFGSTLDS
jgi:FkbM family methyltransferase